MEIHRTEEEQVEAIKDWWRSNGTSVIVGLALGIAGIFGVRYWMDYQQTQAQQASALYAEVLASMASDQQKSESLASRMAAEYSSSPYASLTALSLAKLKADAGDFQGASSYLQWVLDNAADDGFSHVARLRLARVLMQENKLDEAGKLVKDIHVNGFESEYAELRGDIASATGKHAEAADFYRQALQALQPSSRRSQYLQVKIDDLAVAR